MFEHQWSRVVFTTVTLAGALFVSGCDRKPSTSPTPSTGGPTSGGVSRTTATPDSFPAGIVPANSTAKVDATAGSGNKPNSNKGPADGATAIGGLTGNSNTGATGTPSKGGTPAPTAGDGTVAAPTVKP